MRIQLVLSLVIAGVLSACGSDKLTSDTNADANIRVINAFTTPVDVSVDGNVVISSLAAGPIGTAAATAGGHNIPLRPGGGGGGGGGSATVSLTTVSTGVNTVAATR